MKKLYHILACFLLLLPLCTNATEKSDAERLIRSQQFVWDSGTGYYNVVFKGLEFSEYEAPPPKAKHRTRIWTKMFPFVVEPEQVIAIRKVYTFEKKTFFYKLVLFSSDILATTLRGPPQYFIQ